MEVQQCIVESPMSFLTTNLQEGISVYADKLCSQPTISHCNGFTPEFVYEDKRAASLCWNGYKAPIAEAHTPELFKEQAISPRNGSHYVALSNGHGENPKLTSIGRNGYVEHDTISCNGFHKAQALGTSPERTVGYGRPRSHNQPYSKRSHSWSDPISENDGRFNHHECHYKAPDESGHFTEMRRNGFSFEKQVTKNGVHPQKIGKQLEYTWHLGGHPSLEVHLGLIPQGLSAEFLDEDPSSLHVSNSFPLKPKAGVASHKTAARSHFEGEVGTNHNANSYQNGWHPIAQCARKLTLEEGLEANDLDQRILSSLKRYGTMKPMDIANAVGTGTNDEVIRSLCGLHSLGLVSVRGTTDGPVVVTASSRQSGLDNRSSPGVIGEERGNVRSVERAHNEDVCAQLRMHSSSGPYDTRPRREPRVVDGIKPWMRSNSNGTTPGERSMWNYCKLCRISLVSEAQYEEHLHSTKHQNKVAKFNAIPYKKFCEYCKVHLNSESQAKEHFSSGRHEQTVAKSQKAPPQQHLPLITVSEQFTLQQSTSTQPYHYQLELYIKAMKTNAVCFLPTGTGKTLVAALVIARMLKLNPSRQVVFLVDRVLLVLQQSDYLRKELSHVRVADERDAFKGTRPIRIGAVCGEMRKLEGNARIYEQDVLIITADCYRNHLNNGTLRFDDVSLIVLDEAHHCNKDHPYNVIIRDFYLREDDLLGHRPKILGLTASPAGEISLDKTTKRLQRLLGNLGDAQLLAVTKHVQELEEKTNRAPPECILASYTSTEHQLMEILVEYVTKAFNIAVRLSEMKDYKDIFQPASGGHFSIDDICPVLRVIDKLLLSRPESNALYSLLHFQHICEALCTLQECGEQIAIYQMAELTDEQCPYGFHWAENAGLPYSKVKSCLENNYYLRKGRGSENRGPDSGVEQLMKQLLTHDWTGANGLRNCLVLVLVKRARTARYLAKYLSNCRELFPHLQGIRTTYISGNGAGSPFDGMSQSTPGDVICQIREGLFQIVVTTSVAEEGLDLPAPSLVIQMDPSSSVSALVQIRGHAPLNEARFVAICRNDEQAKKIEDLLKREENMKRSARFINGL